MILAKKIAHNQWLKNVDISRGTGIDQSTLSKIMNERRKPYPSEAKRIAEFLGYDGDIRELFLPEGACPFCGRPLT